MTVRGIIAQDKKAVDTSTALAAGIIGAGGLPYAFRAVNEVTPPSASTAVAVGILGAAVHKGAASTGHNVGGFFLVDNQSGNTLTAMYAVEGRVHHSSATTTSQTASFIAAAQMTTEGALGTITAHIDFLSPAFSNVSHMSSRFSWVNQDANKGSLTEGYLNVKGDLRQHDHGVEAASAWVNYDASSGTPTRKGNYNVSSLTDGGVGITTINFTNALAAGFKAVNGTANDSFVLADGTSGTSSVNVYTYSVSTLLLKDPAQVGVTIHGGTQ